MENKELQKYRDVLVEADHQASLNYDKAIMTLSGGALAISITFLKDIVPTPIPETKIYLYVSWIAFALSLTSILVSYLFSMQSLRKAISQVDDESIYTKPVGGCWTKWTIFFRIFATVCFVIGAVGFACFSLSNY